MLLNERDIKMLTENPKDFLEQKRALRQLNAIDRDRINKYRTCAYSTAAKPSSGGGFTVGNSVSKTEICVVKIDEIWRHIQDRRAQMRELSCKIIFVCDNLVEDELNRDIIYYRFLNDWPWKRIELETGLSKRALLKRQEKFLQEISTKVCTFTSKHDNI